jgi:hypothetical protein
MAIETVIRNLLNDMKQRRELTQQTLISSGVERDAQQVVRRSQIAQKTNILLRDTDVLRDLSVIANRFLAGKVKHVLAVEPEEGKAVLAWGRRFSIQRGEVGLENVAPFLGILGWVEQDCSSIVVRLNGNSDGLIVEGENTTELLGDELAKPEVIEMTLARAFLSPRVSKLPLESRLGYEKRLSDADSNRQCDY